MTWHSTQPIIPLIGWNKLVGRPVIIESSIFWITGCLKITTFYGVENRVSYITMPIFMSNINHLRNRFIVFLIFKPFTLVVVIQPLSQAQLFVTPWTAACQATLSFTISRSLLRFMFIESVMLSNRFILCHSFSFCLQSFLVSGSFPMSWLFASGVQIIRVSASASVLPVNI